MFFGKLVLNAYKKNLLRRYDPDGSVFYYSCEDFHTLKCEAFDFIGHAGQKLQGYFYTDNQTRPHILVIFDHGMGCGHKAYMREIATIAERGYTVFAYDHTGTLASGGEHIGGFTQSLCDLDYALKALNEAGYTEGKKIAVIGHSWGGYSTMNIGAFHHEITHLVAISGFASVPKILDHMLRKVRKYIPLVYRSEVDAFGGYAYADATLSLIQTGARALIVHSVDDPTVPYSQFEALKSALTGRENIEFLSLDGKRHNPNLTKEAVRYKDEFFSELTRLKKKKKLATEGEKSEFVAKWDWNKMTEQDMDFWHKVFDFIEN